MSDTSVGGTDPRPAGGRGRPPWTLLAGIAVGVLALDQLTKWWAVNALDDRIIDLVGSLRLRLTYNYGAAFSLSQGRGALISLLAVVVVGVLVVSGRQATRPLPAVALGMVLGGAIGNLTDRALRDGHGFLGGGVVDFIDLQWWPIFNVADSAVVCGALLLVAASWRDEAARPSDDGSGDAAGGAVGGASGERSDAPGGEAGDGHRDGSADLDRSASDQADSADGGGDESVAASGPAGAAPSDRR